MAVTETTRQWCEEGTHPLVTYNPWLHDTWCRCGTRRVPGEQPMDWKAKHEVFHDHAPGEPCRCYAVGKPI